MLTAKPQLKSLYRTDLGEKTRRDYLRLDMNESAEGLPNDFIKGILSKINGEFLAMYPEYIKIQEKIANYNKLKAENICLSNGSDAAIKYIFDAYISSGDKVLLTDPTFAMYPVYCDIFNAKKLTVEYNPDFSFPKERFINHISKDTKMAVVVNPNNPTGSVVKQDILIAILDKAAKNNVLVIVDEAYYYFYPKTVMHLVKSHRNLIVLRTFSKLCGLAALRLGYAASSPEIIENLKKVKPTFDVNGLAALFAQRLLDNPNLIQALIEDTDKGKRYLIQKLQKENIDYKSGYANFILIKCGKRVDAIIDKLSKEKILVGGKFKQGFLKDYIRVTVDSPRIMAKFWESFIKIWERK